METSVPLARNGAFATGLAALLATGIAPAWAINGAQPGGHGAANAAMGGASIALPLDAEAAANNPAGMAFVPRSSTLGLQVFDGSSSSNYILPGNELHNDTTTGGPEGGINWPLGGGWTAGLSIAVGGAGSDYQHAALPVPGAPNAKTRLDVVELVPTVAWQPSDRLALGFSLNLAHERFEAQGLIVPALVPGGLLPLPSHGRQQADGVGVRAGLLWKPLPELTLGLNLKSRTRMGRLSGYEQDLLAYSDGRLDVPGEYGIGLAWQATSALTLAADWLQVNWGGIEVMKDPAGFQWRNQPIARIGAAWKLDDSWTLRAGYSRNRRQVSSDRTVQNLLVPAIHDHAITAGASWQASPRDTVTLGYEFDPRATLDGTGASTGTSLTSQVQMLMLSWQHGF